PTNYPGCTEIGGDVFIKGNDIINLMALNSITHIKGHLRILDNPLLGNLDGLNNLTFVDGLFSISNNAALNSIEHLLSLQKVGNSFGLSKNNNLTSLHGLENLRETGSFGFSSCYKILNLSGLENLEIALDIGFYDTYLTTLNGLNSLKKVNQIELNLNTKLKSISSINLLDSVHYIRIKDNPELESINGFNNLKKVSNFLSIVNNDKLVNFIGFENLSSIKDLLIGYNPALNSFVGFDNLSLVTGLFLINNNKSLKNLEGLIKLRNINGEMRIIENDSIVNLMGGSSLEVANHIAIIKNPRLISTQGFPNLVKINTALNIGDNQRLQNCNGFNSLKSIDAGYMNIYENPNLLNLDGFPSLISIGGKLQISKNNRLASISGFNNLHDIGFAPNDAANQVLYISENPELLAINGFKNLSKCNYLSISTNAVLDEINGFEKLNWVSELGISGNHNLKEIKTFVNVNNNVRKIWLSNSSMENISGLRNLKADSMTYLYIRGNTNLNSCNLKFICDFVNSHSQFNNNSTLDPNYYISWNGNDCNIGNDLPFTPTSQYSKKNDLKCSPLICNSSSLIVNNSNSKCINDSMSLSAIVTGKLPIQYKWFDGSSNSELTFRVDSINNIGLLTDDGEGCRNYYDTTFYGMSISKPLISIKEESCFKCNNAEIAISVSDTTLQIQWSDHDSLFVRKNLGPGTYHFRLMSNLGCTYDSTIIISPFICKELKYSKFIENPKCFNDLGMIKLEFNTVNNIKEVAWDNGSFGNENLVEPGTSIVHIITEDLCEYADTFTVTAPQKIETTLAKESPQCDGVCDGKILVKIGGGVSPYISTFDTQIFNDSLLAICSGEYLLSITDSNNCKL
ncbi:MAG: hypothetical protein IT245_03190, partial [Bacteroidia bacterium]|nr:hypothetical protein [Bacteroidia bacterium]